MAMHVYTPSGWKTLNNDRYHAFDTFNTGILLRGSAGYITPVNGKVYNGSAWKGFLDNISLTDSNPVSSGFGTLQPTWEIQPNGGINISQGGNYGPTAYDTWNDNPDNSGLYEIYVEQITGPFIQGSALNTWLNLGTYRAWYFQATYDTEAVMTVLIRHATTQTQVSYCTVTLTTTTFG